MQKVARVLLPFSTGLLFILAGYRYHVPGMDISANPPMVLVKAIVVAIMTAVAVDLFVGKKGW